MLRRKRGCIWVFLLVVALCLVAVIVVGGGILLFRYPRGLQAMLREPPPLVSFHAPGHGQEVVVGATIVVEVEAVAPGGEVRLLQLWADGVLVGEVTSSSPATANAWLWVPTSPGDHTLVARAFNRRGTPGLAAVRVRAVIAEDADQDGVADGADACPDRLGLISLNGCPPGMAHGVSGDPETQGILEQWVPPAVTPGSLGEEQEGPIGEEGAPAGEEGAAAEEGAPAGGEEGAAAEEGGGLLKGFCPICGLRERLLGEEEGPENPWIRNAPPGLEAIGADSGEGAPGPSEEGFPAGEGAGIALQVEVSELRTAVGWEGVYCYIRFGDEDWQRVPEGASLLLPQRGGVWNTAPFLGGDNAPVVIVPEGSLLRIEMECLGRLADPRAEPLRLGHLRREHGPADWNGEPIVARVEEEGRWFEITYRICSGLCTTQGIPAPYGLHLTSEPVGGRTLYRLQWSWAGNREDIDGFHVYLCYPSTGNCFLVETTTWQSVVLAPHYVALPCGRIHRFQVRAFRYVTEGGVTTSLESPPSEPLWIAGPAACSGPNRLVLESTRGPTRDLTPFQARMLLQVGYHYVGDHGDRVTIFALPLKDGEPDPSFLWRGVTISQGAEDGEAWVDIFYVGTERHVTDGLRLMMLSEDEGEIFHWRDLQYPVEWYPTQPDLTITRVYPQLGVVHGLAYSYVVRAIVENRSNAPARWDGAIELRLADGRVLPAMAPPTTIFPQGVRTVDWPWWEEDIMPQLYPDFAVIVDPYGRLPETDETNNVYIATPTRVRVVWDKLGFAWFSELDFTLSTFGCFDGLAGEFQARVGDSLQELDFKVAARYNWKNVLGPEWDPHEVGFHRCFHTDRIAEVDFRDVIALLHYDTCLEMERQNEYWLEPAEVLSEMNTSEEQCRIVAEQGYGPEDDSLVVPVWTNLDLVLRASLYDVDVEYQASRWGWVTRFEPICSVQRVVSFQELQQLPRTVVLGSQEEGCVVTVQLEPLP